MNKKSYCLSSDDIYNFFDGKVKILTYKDIDNYDNLEQLLRPYNRVVVLFESSKNRGHWCSIHSNGKETFFFDPYGIKPPNQLKYSSGMNRYLKQRRDTLLRLFEGKLIKYNPIPLQEWKRSVNTCGRWVLARLSCDDLNSYQFADLIKSQTNDPDQFITDVTNKFLIG